MSMPTKPSIVFAHGLWADGSCFSKVSSPAILVGHSQGGTIISGAGADDRVAGLVYVAALAPDFGETAQSLQAKFPQTEIFEHIDIADGRIWLRPDGIEYFAGDLPEKEQKEVWATQGVPAADPVREQDRKRRLEVEAELVHRGEAGPHRPAGARALLCPAHGRHHL